MTVCVKYVGRHGNHVNLLAVMNPVCWNKELECAENDGVNMPGDLFYGLVSQLWTLRKIKSCDQI